MCWNDFGQNFHAFFFAAIFLIFGIEKKYNFGDVPYENPQKSPMFFQILHFYLMAKWKTVIRQAITSIKQNVI